LSPAGKTNCRYTLHIHAGDVYLLKRLPFGRAIARYVVNRADSILADGSHVRDTLNELVGFDTATKLQPMGVYCDHFENAAAMPTVNDTIGGQFPAGYVLFVGRLVEKKGTTFLIQAMEQISREFPGLGLVIVGTGPLESQLRQQVQNLGLNESVYFAGAHPHSHIACFLRNSRAVAVPSIMDSNGETEGMPTVITKPWHVA
jgi:glycosyltransferase involved in cell wall biosynthesis